MGRVLQKLDENGLYFHHIQDRYPDAGYYNMHAHEHYELFILVSGRGAFMIEGTEYSLEPGCVFIMRPAEAHRILIDSAHPYERMVFEFSSQAIKSFDPHGELLKAYHSRSLGEKNKYPRQYFPRSLTDYISGASDSGLAGPGLHFAAITTVINFLNHVNRAFNRPDETSFQAHYDVTKELVEYINGHLFEDLSLSSLCTRFYMSDSHLGRLFKSATGCSIAKYISIKRLLEARKRINNGVSAVTAAKECGYNDYSAFYRAYVKRFGCSPSRNRGAEQHKGKINP